MKVNSAPYLTIPVFLILILFCFKAKAQSAEKGIHFFTGTWKEAMDKAKKERKHIFLDAYASWCGPCKTMDREVYTDSVVGRYFNDKFISIRIDMEKGEGPAIQKRFPSIDGYPSLLFFDADGHLNKTILGSMYAKRFLQEAMLTGE